MSGPEMSSVTKKLIEDNIRFIENEQWEALAREIGPHNFCSIIPYLLECDISLGSILPTNKKAEEDVIKLIKALDSNEENKIPLMFASLLKLDFWGTIKNREELKYLSINDIAHIAHNLGFNVFKSTLKNPGNEWPDGFNPKEDYLITQIDHVGDILKEYENVWEDKASASDFTKVNW